LQGYKGYRGELQDQSLAFGSAVHLFIESYLKGEDENIATARATNYYKKTSFLPDIKRTYQTPEYLTGLCNQWLYTYTKPGSVWKKMKLVNKPVAVGEDKQDPMVEMNFAIPYFESEWCTISLCGTIDSFYQLDNGVYIINDWKTSSDWDHDLFFYKFKLSNQLLTYVFAVKLMADDIGGKLAEKNPAALELYNRMVYGQCSLGATVSPIFMKGKDELPILKRSPINFFSFGALLEYQVGLDNLCEKINKLAQKLAELPIREGLFNGACQGDYGKLCPFYAACSEDLIGQDMEAFLSGKFIVVDYNPLMFRK
jgi:hypothetical protein